MTTAATSRAGRLLLPEEMILLLASCSVSPRQLRCAVGAAGLTELILSRRARIEGWSRFGVQMKRVTVIDRTPLGDDVLDALVESLAEQPQRRRLLYYSVPRVGAYFLRVCRERLLASGMIDRAGPGTRATTPYVIRDLAAADGVRARVARALLGTPPGDARSLALAGFVHGAGLTSCVVAADDVKAARRAGKRLVKGPSDATALLGPVAADTADAVKETLGLVRDLVQSVDMADGGDGGNGGDGAY